MADAILKKWPNGHTTQLFGDSFLELNPKTGKKEPFYKFMFDLDGHNGLDIARPFRTPILGTKGTVCDIKDTPIGLGRHIRILTPPDDAGDCLEISYGHLDEILVKIGDKVEDGQIIGRMGNTGSVVSSTHITNWGAAPANSGVHLHLGIREANTKNGRWKTYNGLGKLYIKNYTNGYKGAVDPMKYIVTPEQQDALTRFFQAVKVAKDICGRL